ncbi:MAG: AzlD domain-containing protein [Thiothrix sp.]|nr:AzlD domain-containing protein [Thiothrix sp.]HPQ96589.1 AzlD domain-containing protein [Thiolinea sp.]
MQRHLLRRADRNTAESMPLWLSVLGPSMVAAMFGVSLVPATPTPVTWAATAFGVVLTLLIWYRTRSLGWPILAGVATYGMALVLGNMVFYQ